MLLCQYHIKRIITGVDIHPIEPQCVFQLNDRIIIHKSIDITQLANLAGQIMASHIQQFNVFLVESSYAVQAGREVRILVQPDKVSDDEVILLARNVAKKIENELDYPGQIKVSVIRESRATEYAK